MSWGYLWAAAAQVPGDDLWLGTAERAQLARLAARQRREAWRLGRWAAKRALAAWLGFGDSAFAWSRLEILPESDGRPLPTWRSRPLPCSLSLSHREGVALAAVAGSGRAVGCDVERIEPRSAAFVADFFTARERSRIASAPVGERDLLANLIWSAKESVLKLLGVGLTLDTRRLEVEIGAGAPVAGWFTFVARDALLNNHFGGWWRHEQEFLATFSAHPESDPPRALAPESRAQPA